MKKFLLFLTVFTGISLLLVFGGNNSSEVKSCISGKPALVADEIIVKFDTSVTSFKKEKIRKDYGLSKKAESRKAGKFVVYKHGNPTAVLNRLKNEPGVVYAEQNGYMYGSMVPNDALYPQQWHMTRIGMEQAWDISTGAGVIVAICDSGVMQSLEDLANTNFMPGYDFVNDDNDPTDDHGHGSHICGTIAQSTNNGIGCAGIAYNATIMPVKVLNKNNFGSWEDIANGIYYAVDNGASIINFSIGGTSHSDTLKNAVDYAWNNGVLVVCAAGNSNKDTADYPAIYPNAMAISATTIPDVKASYSSYGPDIELTAPGGDYGDEDGDGHDDMVLQNTLWHKQTGYYYYSGTSMATPHVVGVAALMKSIDPSLTNVQLRNMLIATAEDIGAPGWDEYFGYGMVDAYAAVLAAGGTPTNQPPNADFTFTTNDLTATFTDASGDPDGTVVSWDWDFGDTAGSTAQHPSHTYASGGTYSVTLTVTDNDGAVDSVTKPVTVSGSTGDRYLFVNDIAITVAKQGRNYKATAVITIFDTLGAPVPDAAVSVSWSGVVTGTDSGVTGADGTVSITSPRVASTGPFTVTVTGVTHAVYQYDSALNVETSDSASY